jgi:hypothetical protein
MTDLDTSIRQGLSHLVDLTPMTPSFDEIASPARGHKRRRRHAIRIGGVTLAALLAVGGPTLALGISNPFAHSYQPGDELTARYGLSVPPSEVGHASSAVSSAGPTLEMEVGRRHGLVVRQGEFLPTGPVGPIYAQIIGLHPGTKKYAQVVVMTAQPKEAMAAAESAAGTDVPRHVRFDGISAQLFTPWGQNDSVALSWRPSPSVGVVVASGPAVFGISASLHQLEQLAIEVKRLERVPQLATNPISKVGGGGELGGYWSLVPTFATRLGGSVWSSNPTLSNLLGTRIARGSTAGHRWTARVTGDPATGSLSIGGIGVNAKTEQPVFTRGLSATSSPGPPTHLMLTPPATTHATLMLVDGSAPEGVRAVRIVLSDGSAYLVPTVSSTLGWHRQLFGTALPVQTAYVSRIEALNAHGKVVLSAEGALLDLRGNSGGMLNTQP